MISALLGCWVWFLAMRMGWMYFEPPADERRYLIMVPLLALFTAAAACRRSWALNLLLLAAVLTPGLSCGVVGFDSARYHGRVTGCKSKLKDLATGLEMYASDNAGLYPVQVEQLTPLTLKTLPTCPIPRAAAYSYVRSHDAKAYTIRCQGTLHVRDTMGAAGFPAYDSFKGLLESP